MKIQNDKYISLVMNMLIMYHIHHLSMEMEGELTKGCKSITEITNQVSSTI